METPESDSDYDQYEENHPDKLEVKMQAYFICLFCAKIRTLFFSILVYIC